MGAHIDIRIQGLDQAIGRFEMLASARPDEVCDTIGAMLVTQTQTRIASGKTSPSGEAWKPNAMGTSILFRSGNLAVSIYHQVSGWAVKVGSDLVYAAIHNFGGTIKAKKAKALRFPGQARQDIKLRKSITMPKREYLGVSPENAKEIVELVEEHYGEKLK